MPSKPEKLSDIIKPDELIAQLSVDCVVFGFHDYSLKVLLLKSAFENMWALPGGFIRKDESVEKAAHRILKMRTGIENVFLKQLRVFGQPDRKRSITEPEVYKLSGLSVDQVAWLAERFITIGFYALVDYTKTVPSADLFSSKAEWVNLNEFEDMIMDHHEILNAALETLRLQLNYQPIGYNLLPEKFTMSEIQKLYEAILGKKLDRRNFQRKINSFNILDKLDERKTGCAYRAPFLYRFNKEKYQKALTQGLYGGW